MWVGGMRMSTIATSGAFSSTSRESSSASPPGRRPRSRLPPSRRETPSAEQTESSAITTRMESPLGAASRALRGLSTAKAPPSASTRSASPRRPGAPGRIGAPDAVVRDLDDRAAVAAADRDGDTRRRRVLGDVGQRLGDDVVGGRLDGLGQAPVERDGDVDRHRRAVGELLSAGPRPRSVRIPGWMPWLRLAQLLQRHARAPRAPPPGSAARPPDRTSASTRRGRAPSRSTRAAAGWRRGGSARCASALRVRRLDDARARGPELVQAGPQLGLEPLVLEREPCGGADGVDELGVLAQRRVVDERGDAPPLRARRSSRRDGRPQPGARRAGRSRST